MLLVVSLFSLLTFLCRYNCKISDWFVAQLGSDNLYKVNITLGEPETDHYDIEKFSKQAKNNGIEFSTNYTTYCVDNTVWYSFKGVEMDRNEDQNLQFTLKKTGEVEKLKIESADLKKAVSIGADTRDCIVLVKYTNQKTMSLGFKTIEEIHHFIEWIEIGIEGEEETIDLDDFYIDRFSGNIIINLPSRVVRLLKGKEFTLYYKLIDENRFWQINWTRL